MRRSHYSLLAVGTVLAVISLLALVPSQPAYTQPGARTAGPNVRVVNTSAEPVPVTGTVAVANPVEVVQEIIALSRIANAEDTYTVPPGKRLVIEYLSGQASIRGGDLTQALVRTTVGTGGSVDHTVPLTPAYSLPNQKGYTFGQVTRLYADPGTEVSVHYSYLGVGDNQLVIVKLSGYLVDVP